METIDKAGRHRIIEELVARWIRKNPGVIQIFADNVKDMRQGRASENQAMSYKVTLPGDLFRQLDYALSETDDQRLFVPDGELEWFSQRYPEFNIPYDRSTLVK